jgi:hypothetical protein
LENNIQIYLKEMRWEDIDWICLAQNTGYSGRGFQLLAYADDVVDASKEVGLEINVQKSKYKYVFVLSSECR